MADARNRSLEMYTNIEGVEFPVVVEMDNDRIQITNGDHGQIYLSWVDYNKVLAEVISYRRATDAANAPLDDDALAAE